MITLPWLFALLAALTPANAAPCSVALVDLAAKVDAAELAYATFEVERFSTSMDEAALMLPCLTAPVTPAVSAHYLRMLGMQYVIARSGPRADEAFAAARALDPTYTFPESLVPVGHPIRTHYVAIDPASLHGAPIAPARTGSLLFNGAPISKLGPERPGWPALTQVMDDSATVTTTALVFPADSLPAYDAAPVAVISTSDAARRPSHASRPLAIGGAVAAVGAGVLYAVATGAAASFRSDYDPNDSEEAMLDRRDRVNGLVIASAGVGVLAVAGGVGAVLVGKW